MKTQILLVDDDPYTRRLFEGLLRSDEIAPRTVADVTHARRAFHETDFNLIILDQRLPDGNGLDLFAETRAERPQQMAILITGFADVRDAMRAVRDGLFDYLTKPFENLDELRTVIDRALEMDRAYREIVALRETLGTFSGGQIIVSRSAVMEKVLAQVRQAAPLDTKVLIEGESGTGKEIIAKQLHALSGHAEGPLMEINCGALSESLLEASLFGYEKGAFTGAGKTTPGYFEEADGGTLLLDEITDMSPKLQASLLRVLQEHTFTRLGSTAQRSSDFRLICATNKSLEAEVKAGRFRTDLFYRINVVAIRLPPLRERREDIMPLALLFLEHFRSKFGKSVGPLAPETIEIMESAPWTGNVRELRNAMERAVVINAGGPITPAALGISSDLSVRSRPATAQLPYREAREKFEREYFSNLLQLAGGNISEAARLAGLARQNFYNHIEPLGIGSNS
jgi:two-component system response regulator HydG